VRGKLDLRDESLRATAEKLRLLSSAVSESEKAKSNGSDFLPLCLHFSAGVGSEELREVQALLAGSPGQHPVRLFFETAEGETLRVDAGAEFHVSVTAELEQQLRRWLISAMEERAKPSGERTEA